MKPINEYDVPQVPHFQGEVSPREANDLARAVLALQRLVAYQHGVIAELHKQANEKAPAAKTTASKSTASK